MRVIVVDDHIVFRQGLVRLLSAETAFEVVGQAGTVREAVEQAISQKADLVLLDTALPDGSGFKALNAIVSRRPGCLVVMLTGHDSDEYLFAALRSGARGFVLKGMPGAKLIKALHALRLYGEPVLSRQMTRRVVEEFSRSDHHADSNPARKLAQLTAREMEILRYLAQGASNRDIALSLAISENTVKVHVRNLCDKLQLNSRQQAASFARLNGLLGRLPAPDGDESGHGADGAGHS